MGFPSGTCPQCRRHEFHPWVRQIPWRRKWQPTPGFLPGESHGQRSLAGYSPRGRKESDTTEHTQVLAAAHGSLVAVRVLSFSAACGILVPQPRIEPTYPALQGGLLTTGSPGKSRKGNFWWKKEYRWKGSSWNNIPDLVSLHLSGLSTPASVVLASSLGFWWCLPLPGPCCSRAFSSITKIDGAAPGWNTHTHTH